MRQELIHLDLGLLAYDAALDIQRRLLAVVQDQPQTAFLLTVEHSPAVITLGRNAKAGNVLASPERLAALGVEVRHTTRGGDVTLHSPGQLVAYPILHVERCGGLRRYVHLLEEAVIRLLARYGLAAGRVDGLTGVWVGGSGTNEKIAAIGIGVSRWVAYHGLALNVSTDLSCFDLIVPCGLSGKKVTSMARLLGQATSVDEVKPQAVEFLAGTLGFGAVRKASLEDIPRFESASASQPPSPSPRRRLPPWLTRPIGPIHQAPKVRRILSDLNLATVCTDALCPNRPECYARGTATFMIMGRACTRSCRFCAVAHASPGPLNPDEPANLAQAALRMRLRHVVITSVTRDDLPDGGAAHFAACIRAVRDKCPKATVEVLTPDFQGSIDSLRTVVQAGPDVFNHNIETVPRLYSLVRPQADYRRSLRVLQAARRLASESARNMLTKSGIMVGLGERSDEVQAAMRDLRDVGCDILTIGQYLAPSDGHLPVAEFVVPEQFDRWRQQGLEMGFSAVASGPFVRSSYNAQQVLGEAVSS